jgi:hypothetical protein
MKKISYIIFFALVAICALASFTTKEKVSQPQESTPGFLKVPKSQF